MNSLVRHFKSICTDTETEASLELRARYTTQRKNYIGSPFVVEHQIDTELVEQVVGSMQRGKAAGLDDLSTEHLLYCHPLLLCRPTLAKLFDLFYVMVMFRYNSVSAVHGSDNERI